MRSDTDEGYDSQSALSFIPKVFNGLCVGHSRSSALSADHNVMAHALCTGIQSCWKRKGSSPNCFFQHWSIDQSKPDQTNPKNKQPYNVKFGGGGVWHSPNQDSSVILPGTPQNIFPLLQNPVDFTPLQQTLGIVPACCSPDVKTHSTKLPSDSFYAIPEEVWNSAVIQSAEHW